MMRPTFLPVLTLSWRSTGIGMMATSTSDTIVTMAYAVKDGPGARHVPTTAGSHDLLTCGPMYNVSVWGLQCKRCDASEHEVFL